MNAARSARLATATARARLLLWCAALVLLCQLFGAVGHDHDNEARAQECVACSVQAHALATPPAPQAGAPAVAPLLLHAIAAPPVALHPATRASYLLPQPHAPPGSPLSV